MRLSGVEQGGVKQSNLVALQEFDSKPNAIINRM